MKNLIKQELINDILTGLVVAATFAVAAPSVSFAQTLTNAVSGTGTNIITPVMQGVAYGCYAVGAFVTVSGIAGAKKHADQPGSNPLGPAVGKLCAGAAFLAAPSVVKIIQGTGSTTLGGGQAAGSGLTIGF